MNLIQYIQDSDSVNQGSNPCLPARNTGLPEETLFIVVSLCLRSPGLDIDKSPIDSQFTGGKVDRLQQRSVHIILKHPVNP